MRRARRKKKNKRRMKNIAFVVAAIIIVGLVYLSRDAWLSFFEGILERGNNQVSTVQNDGELMGGNYPIDISKKTHTKIGSLQKNWTLFADTTFYVYDTAGDIVYSEQAPYSNPIIDSSERRVLIYDQGGTNFCVLGPKNLIYSKRLTDQILYGSIGPDGSAAIVTATEKYTSYLTIYDKNGSEIYHWADGSMITSVAINSSGKGCLVSASYARGGIFRTVVTKLDFSSPEIVMETVPLDTLGFEVRYCTNGFWLLGRDRLYRLNNDGAIEMNLGYDYELIDFDLSDSLAALVFESAGGSGGMVSILSTDSETPVNKAVEGRVNDCLATDKTVYILTDVTAESFDKDGNHTATAPLDRIYREFAVLGDEIYLLGYRTVEKIEFGT